MKKKITKPVRVILSWFKQLSKKKKALAVIVALVVTAVLIGQYQSSSKTPSYELATAKLSAITEVVSETGNVTTTGSFPAYSTTTGVVDEVMVSNGTYVIKDEVLFSVSSTATKQEKEAALSTYLAARTAFESAKATQLSLQATMFGEWDEFKELAESDDYEEGDGTPRYGQRAVPEFHIPEKEWLTAELNYKNQQIAINQTAASMRAAWQAYQATKDSEVSAVLGGEIRNLGVTPGDAVTVYTALTAGSNSPALVIFNPDVKTVIKTDLGETDAIKVKAGQEVTVEFDAIPNESYAGRVDRVNSITNPTGGVVKYSTYVILTDHVNSLKGGMTADVDITVATKNDVLTVPSSAVKPHEGGRAVRVVGANGEIEFVPVTTGSRGDGDIEILSGITAGTEVITALRNEQIDRNSSFF